MLQKLAIGFLIALAYVGFFATPFLREFKLDYGVGGNASIWQCLWFITSVASAVGSFIALEKIWNRSRFSRVAGLLLLCVFCAPVLVICLSSQSSQAELLQTSSEFERGSARRQTILTLYVEQTQLDPDPAIRAQAAQQLFKHFALRGTWLDADQQLQLYTPTAEELEKAQPIKLQRTQARAEFETFFTTKYQNAFQEIQDALLITLVTYLVSLFLLLTFRALRGDSIAPSIR